MIEPIYFSTNSHPISNQTFQIMRVDLDGGFTVNESIPATDAAKEVLRIMKEQWLTDVQCAKIRELQSNLNESNELVEYLQDRIKRLEEAGDGVVSWIEDCKPYSEQHKAISNWIEAKEDKP